jgi:hypothetical protein
LLLWLSLIPGAAICGSKRCFLALMAVTSDLLGLGQKLLDLVLLMPLDGEQ